MEYLFRQCNLGGISICEKSFLKSLIKPNLTTKNAQLFHMGNTVRFRFYDFSDGIR